MELPCIFELGNRETKLMAYHLSQEPEVKIEEMIGNLGVLGSVRRVGVHVCETVETLC